jgi:amino acid transporter
MAHNGIVPRFLGATHVRHETPGRALIVTGGAALLPPAILAARHASGLDVYGWMGSLATYGFIVVYGLVCLALPGYLRLHGAHRASAKLMALLAAGTMLLALIGNLYPVPQGPYGKLPYLYLAYLAVALLYFWLRPRPTTPPSL